MKRLFILSVLLLNSAAHAASDDVIRLESSDGAYVDMPMAVVSLSKTLLDMRADIDHWEEWSITVPFSAPIVQQGVEILKFYNQRLHESYADVKKALIESGLITPENAVGVLNFLNYLDAFDAHPALVDAVALMVWNAYPDIEQLQRLLPPELVNIVARAEFIHRRFKTVMDFYNAVRVRPVAYFDLSIADLAQRGLLPPISDRFELNSMGISSLVGLSDVAGIDKIDELSLDYNQLTEIRDGAFAGLPNLRFLRLSGNQLTEIRDGTVAGLPNLRFLYLSGNQLTEIMDGAFAGLPNLWVLHLDHNQLTEIRDGTVAGLPNLRFLCLNGNQLTEIMDGAFAGVPNLWVLHLHNNQLTEIRDGTVAGLLNLQALNLNHNRLTPANLRVLREHLPNTQIQADDQAPSLLQRLNPFTW